MHFPNILSAFSGPKFSSFKLIKIMENDDELEFLSGGSGSESDDNFSDATNLNPDNVNENDNDGEKEKSKSLNFPLHKAAFKGNRVELTRLLRKGCDVGQKDVHGTKNFAKSNAI